VGEANLPDFVIQLDSGPAIYHEVKPKTKSLGETRQPSVYLAGKVAKAHELERGSRLLVS
jgi:hypothetical protein